MNIRTIRAKVRSFLRLRAGDMLSRLPQDLRRYGESAVMPADPVARAYIELTQAAIRAMDASIGGGPEHDAACLQFEEAYGQWQRALQGGEV